MLVACSGSQGSGKSTILAELEKQGKRVVTRKTSRSILAEWDKTLSEVNSVPELTIQFQEEILTRKFQDELAAITSQELFFTERTYADLFTYALVALGNDNQFSDWLDSYYIRCMQYQQMYTSVFYLTAGHFNVVKDGVRGDNRHYSRMVDLIMRDVTQQMTPAGTLTVINTPSLTDRVGIITCQSEFISNPLQYLTNLVDPA